MKSRQGWFNIYFICLLAAACAGCASLDKNDFGKKQVATMRLYMETGHAASGAGKVLVTRQKIPMSVESEPFLDETDLSNARLVDDADGTFSIELTFNDHGAMLLEMKSVEDRGRHIVLFSHFPPPGTKQTPDEGDSTDKPKKDDAKPGEEKARSSGWISAVLINGRMSTGSLVFTPDTSREEAQRIVLGLRNVIKKVKATESL